MKKLLLAGFSTILIAQPITANAQLGGLGHALGGGSSAGSAQSGPSPDAFLSASVLSTKNVMIAAALLAQAVQDHTKLTGVKAYADQIANSADPKALDAMKTSLQSNLDALNARKDLAGDVTAAYNAGDAQQKKLIGLAVVNMTLGIYRDTKLVGQAPGVISSIGSNPMMLGKLGQIKTAASLLALQTKGLAAVGTALPKIMSAVKITPPAMAETTQPTPWGM